MKHYKKLFMFVLLPSLLTGQEIDPTTLLHDAINKRIALFENQKHSNTNHFELLTKISNYNKLLNHPAKSNLNLKQRLDSSIRVLVSDPSIRSKNYFTYNDQGKETSYINKNWNESKNTYLNFIKTESGYNTQGNITYRILYNGEGLNWISFTKSEFSYLPTNKLGSVIEYGWNSNTSQWDSSSQILYNYDINGSLVLRKILYRNDLIKQWSTSWITEYQYNYDTSGSNTIITTLQYLNNKWSFHSRDEYGYNNAGKNISWIAQYWDEISGNWVNFIKVITNYNSNLFPIRMIWFGWNEQIGQFQVSEKDEINYDVYGNLSNSINFNWDEQNQTWIPYYNEECSYNNQFLYEELILPVFDPNFNLSLPFNRIYFGFSYFSHMLTKISTFTYEGGSFHNYENFEFYYSGVNITKTNNQSNSDIQIAPNPVNDYFTILINEVNEVSFSLFDLNGKQIISKKIISNESISTKILSKGIYCYRIISDNKPVQTGKLVIN